MFNQDEFNCKNNVIYVSLGNYCLTSMLLKENNLKCESHPFDWMVSCIDNIIDIFNDNFIKFKDKKNYLTINTNHNGTMNTLYFKNTQKLFPNILCEHQHHDFINNNKEYDYLLRCIERLTTIFNKHNNVVFIMIQPLYLNKNILNYEKINELYIALKIYYQNNKFKLLIFNISNVSNDNYKEEKINEELYIFELKTQMVKGNFGMMYFDEKGIIEFLKILQHFNN